MTFLQTQIQICATLNLPNIKTTCSPDVQYIFMCVNTCGDDLLSDWTWPQVISPTLTPSSGWAQSSSSEKLFTSNIFFVQNLGVLFLQYIYLYMETQKVPFPLFFPCPSWINKNLPCASLHSAAQDKINNTWITSWWVLIRIA